MLVDLLRARAATEPDADAFVVAGGDSLTYRSWDFRSDALCRGLRERGVVPGDRVVLCFDARRWTDFAVSYAGVHKAGAVPVLCGPQVPDTALERAVAQSGAWGVVTSSTDFEEDKGGGDAPPPVSSDLAHISYRFSPLQAFRPKSFRTNEILAGLAVVDDAVASSEKAPFLHAFDPASDVGSRALWVPLGRQCRPVIVLPTFDPHALCTLTVPHEAAGWALDPATAGWLLDSGVLEGHDLASVVRLIVLHGQASPALRSRLGASLPRAAIVTRPDPPSFFVALPVSETANATTFGEGRDKEQSVPVAFSQEGMLWHEVFAPGSQNLPPLVRRYRGTLDVAALERALAEIVRRHEPLRTTFEVRGGRPVQIVSPPGELRLPVLDLAGLDPGAQDVEVATLLAAVARPFDLVEGPMFEASLVRLSDADHLVVLRVHHSVYDDWSVSVFRRELSVLYRAFAAGEPSPLADLPISFSDFSRRQHRRLAGPQGAAELDWWKEHLAGAPLSLQLPIDDPDRPPGAPQDSAEPVSVDLGPELSAQLRALARRERTTLFMTMLGAFEVLLHRYTGQSELLAASVVANRNRPELEAMVGCFTKKVLVRLDGTGDPTFVELLPRVRTAVVGALAHQDLPFETVLQGALGSAAAVHGLVPQVAVMFQGVTPQSEEVVLPGLETSGYDTSATTTRTHFSAGEDGGGQADAVPWGAGLYLGTFLILSVIEEVDRVSLAARGAFHRPSVQRLLATFETLLADIVAHPTKRISELRLLSDDDRAELVPGHGAAAAPLKRAQEVFEDQVAQHPARPAVVEGAGHLTYAELDARAEALSRRLGERGVPSGALVGVYAGCSVASVVAVLAVWKAGAGYVALDPLDSDARLAAVMGAASLKVVVTDRRLRPGPALAGLTVVAVDEAAEERSAAPVGATVIPKPEDPEAVALVVYGSGSPAPAGGVVIGHRGVVNLASGLEAAVFKVSDDSRSPTGLRVCLSAGPTDNAFLRQIMALLNGHTLHLADGLGEVVSGVLGGDIDVIDCSPRDLRELVATGLAPALEARVADGPTPAVVVGSASPIDFETWRVLRSLPAVKAHHLYGPPECGFGVAVVSVSVADQRLVLGPLLGDGMAVVLDPQGAPSPERVSGELVVEGPATSDRPFRTGQLARPLPDGKVELLGNTADVVDLRGFRIDRARIAGALQRCPGVAEVDVVVRQADDGEPHLVARVVLAEGAEAPSLARLQVELWAQLPGYAWPAAVEVAANPAPREEELAEGRVLASLWAGPQGVEHIETSSNYWQSFSFLEVVSRTREVGVTVSDQDVARNRIIATLAAAWAAERSRRDSGGKGEATGGG
ncbi:hypothetical protein BH24ACT1_BH24ACT1_12780 [soil metagenome]